MKFPAFYGTRKFIAAFTTVRHLSLYGTRSIWSTRPLHPTTQKSISILYSRLRLGLLGVSFPQVSPQKPFSHLSLPLHATWHAHLSILHLITQMTYSEVYRAYNSSLYSLLHSPVTSSLSGSNILLRTLFSKGLGLRIRCLMYKILNILYNLNWKPKHVADFRLPVIRYMLCTKDIHLFFV